MTTAAIDHFTQASALLDEAVRRWELELQEFGRASEEKLQLWREKMARTWEEWPSVAQNFKAAVNGLPKELRKRDFVKAALKELDYYEEAARSFFASYFNGISEISLKDSFKTRLESFSERVSELRNHPLIEKFQRGELILASRAKIQWNRKFGHMAFGLFFLYFFEYSPLTPALKWGIYSVFAAACFTLEFLRHRSPAINAWTCRAFRPVMREREKTKVNSAIFFIASMSLVYFIFPRDVAALTMLFIAVGDPMAGLIGVHFGKRKISQHSSLEGTLACFVTCALLAAAAVKWIFIEYSLPDWEIALFAVYAGAVGALAEGSFKKWDDNLVMPLVSAPLLTLFLKLAIS